MAHKQLLAQVKVIREEANKANEEMKVMTPEHDHFGAMQDKLTELDKVIEVSEGFANLAMKSLREIRDIQGERDDDEEIQKWCAKERWTLAGIPYFHFKFSSKSCVPDKYFGRI